PNASRHCIIQRQFTNCPIAIGKGGKSQSGTTNPHCSSPFAQNGATLGEVWCRHLQGFCERVDKPQNAHQRPRLGVSLWQKRNRCLLGIQGGRRPNRTSAGAALHPQTRTSSGSKVRGR